MRSGGPDEWPEFADFDDIGFFDEDGKGDDFIICSDEEPAGAEQQACQQEQIDASDVEIVAVRCSCAQCRLPIPPASIGGQKRAQAACAEAAPATTAAATAPLPTKRLRAKTTPAQVLAINKPAVSSNAQKGQAKPLKAKPRKKPTIRLRPRSQDSPIVCPIAVTTRSPKDGRPGECYILRNTRTGSYLVGCSSRAHKDYAAIISFLADKINSGAITMKLEAKNFVEKFITGQVEWST